MRTNQHGCKECNAVAWTVVLGVFGCAGFFVLGAGCVPAIPTSQVPGSVTLFFDGADAKEGDTSFSFEGANFAGGTVRTLGNPSLYGSGRFSYEVAEGSMVTVDFDGPVDLLELVFIDSGGSSVMTAFDADGNEVGSITAVDQRTSQSVELSASAVRVEAVHTGDGSGWIDNFTFRIAATQAP